MTLVSLDDIREAARRLDGVARLTPLVPVALPDDPPVHLKCENLQLVGAFKFRGAYNMVSRLDPDARIRGVITYSSGNHGQAVALAAKLLNAPSVVVMPVTAPRIKIEGARAHGAEVLFEGTTSLERKRRAEIEAAARGLTMVPPFDHPWIIAGQGTIGLEILRQRPDVESVFVPIGGGGLIAGVATAIKRTRPEVRMIGVEPAGASKMLASRRAGRPVTLERTASIADGLLPLRPGDLTFAHTNAFVDEIVTVEDTEIAATVLWLFRQAKLVVEPSGATAVAGLMRAAAQRPLEGPAVAVLSGGNIDLDTLTTIAASFPSEGAGSRPASAV